MKSFNVNRNIEISPKIYGYKPKYFYMIFIIQLFYIVFVSVYFLSLLAGKGKGIALFFLVNTISILGIFSLKRVLKKQSGVSKYPFSNKRSIVSNKDILNQL